MPKALRIAIEGNIGIGKSTLLPRLQDALPGDWNTLSERADEDPEFARLLKERLQDPTKHPQFQSWITQRRMRELEALKDDPQHYLFERSFFGEIIFSHANLFGRNAPDENFVNFYHNILTALKCYPYDALIYLKAPPETCYERIRQRARDAETKLAFDYVDYVHKCYETHLLETARLFNTPVLVFNWADFGSIDAIARDMGELLNLRKAAA